MQINIPNESRNVKKIVIPKAIEDRINLHYTDRLRITLVNGRQAEKN